jgi:hypothetical protein
VWPLRAFRLKARFQGHGLAFHSPWPGEDWNLVTRWILPLVYQPPVYQGDESDFSLGNFNLSFFFVNKSAQLL